MKFSNIYSTLGLIKGENRLLFLPAQTPDNGKGKIQMLCVLDIFLQRIGCLEVLHLRTPICFGNSGLKFGTNLCKI